MGMQINKTGYYSPTFVRTKEDNFKYAKLVMCEKRLFLYTIGGNVD